MPSASFTSLKEHSQEKFHESWLSLRDHALYLPLLALAWTKPNEAKVVLHRSFWTALGKCSVHILPLATLAGLIYLNYHTHYIGPNFGRTTLDLIQGAAKIQELLCVASLTTIVWQVLRCELLEGGLPVGLLGSATSFSQISSFLSRDFLAALPWSLTNLKRCMVFGLLLLAGGLASVIGPASAVLMLPRSQSFPAGGTSFNAPSDSSFWPAVLSSDTQLPVCSSANATRYATCPSGGYESLRMTMRTFNYTDFYTQSGVAFDPLTQARGPDATRNQATLLVQSPQSLIPAVLSSVWVVYDNLHTLATQPHAGTVILQQQLIKSWFDAAAIGGHANQPFWSAYEMTALGNGMNPWARVQCTDAQNLSAKATEAQFPYLVQTNDSTLWASDYKNGSISSLNRKHSSHVRTQWVQLPMSDFGNPFTGFTTSGLLIEFPWDNTSRAALGCSVTAAWQNGTVSSDRSSNYDAWVVNSMIPLQDIYASTAPVAMDESWLRLLTPPSPDRAISRDGEKDWKPNTLEQIFSDTGYEDSVRDLTDRAQYLWDSSANECIWAMTNSTNITHTDLWNNIACQQGTRRIFAQFVVAMIVADGLSRTGSAAAFDVQPLQRDWTLLPISTYNSTRGLAHLPTSAKQPGQMALWLTLSVVGYAYYANTTTDYLALGAAGLFMLLAAGHLLWVLWPTHLVTSTAWESVTELLILCYQSPPGGKHGRDQTSVYPEGTKTSSDVAKVRVAPRQACQEYSRLLVVMRDASMDERSRGDSPRKQKASCGRGIDRMSSSNVSSRHPTTTPPLLGAARNDATDDNIGVYDRVKTDVKYE